MLQKIRFPNKSAKSGKLILLGVPIGDYEDLSFRGKKILENINLILCEDTRETNKLLLNFGMQKKLCSYIGSPNTAINLAKKTLQEGQDVILLSDRGMPCISDPGAAIVNALRHSGIQITCVPGPSAVLTAYALTGYSGPFIFHGFLPRKDGDIKKVANKLISLGYHIIFFEAPNRLENTLNVLASIFQENEITLARELTKKYEQVLQFPIKEYEKHKSSFQGECVIIIKA